jgi:hypothetical protein
MKFRNILSYFLFPGLMALGFAACKKDKDNGGVTPTPSGNTETYVLSGDVTENKSLSSDHVWTLKGYVYVKSGATLTIPAGTIVKSDIIEKGAIIVEPGAKLMAEGTPDKPIVFTSGQPKGQRRPGDWGGVILLGKAPTNRSTPPTIEGGVNRSYGGNDPFDNSGSLKYVRIEFAGIAASPGSEINGLTCGGVGAGTTLENIMVSYGNDDAYEFFGGTVNARNLIAWATSDDDFDFDFGYTGKIQFAISAKHPQYADIGDASNGIECDNDGSGTSATPHTRPVLSNFTFVGPNGRPNTAANHNYANRWRRSTHFVLNNSVLLGFQKGGFSIESAETGSSYLNGTSEFRNNLVHAIARPFFGNSGSGLTDSDIEQKALGEGNIKLDEADMAKLKAPWSLTEPDFRPDAGSPALSGAAFSGPLADPYFQQVPFRGAVGSVDWTAGWTNWDPNNTDY